MENYLESAKRFMELWIAKFSKKRFEAFFLVCEFLNFVLWQIGSNFEYAFYEFFAFIIWPET